MKQENQFVEVEGVVTARLPKLEYTVEIEFKGIKHVVTCHVSGKLKTKFVFLEKDEKVKVRISLYDIDRGIIVKRMNFRPRFGQQAN